MKKLNSILITILIITLITAIGFTYAFFTANLTVDTETLTIVPNVTSIKNLTVLSLFTTITKFGSSSTYGTVNADTHMMKNLEWGAVAYLSNSKYGNYNNPSTGTEIFINPSISYITGRSGITVSQFPIADVLDTASINLYSWNGYSCETKIGYICTGEKQEIYGMAASTTGNIYGIYDMSGGTYEYVMGNMALNESEYESHTMFPNSAGTVFGEYTNITLLKKYFDIYQSGTTSQGVDAFIRGKLGDATKEIIANSTQGWNSTFAYFINSTDVLLMRGGYYSNTNRAGVWAFSNTSGRAYDYISARVVTLKR